jgi:hypothetical protein
MPARWLTLAIIAFWLGMVALFNAIEIRPRLSPTEPLMFPVDVIDEAGQAKDLATYSVTKNGTFNYKAEVEWHYLPEDDTFESECQLTLRFTDQPEAPREQGPIWLPQFHEVALSSFYRLTRGGEMKAIEATTNYSLVWEKEGEVGARETVGEIKVKAEVKGTPQAGRFAPHVRRTFPQLKGDEKLVKEDEKLGALARELLRRWSPRDEELVKGDEKLVPLKLRDFECDSEAVPVPPRGTVLNPLHPPRRFPALADDQHWLLTVIDPLLSLTAAAAPLGGEPLLKAGMDPGRAAYVVEARVQPGLEGVDWDACKGVPCRVIRCKDGGPVEGLTIWVREKDGVVMRQDFRLWGDSWSFLRNSIAYKFRVIPGQRKVP